jgi:protein TonB
MVFEKSKLPLFILFSLGLHLVLVVILLNLKFEHEHLIPVEVTFSQGASGNGKSKGAEVLSEKKAPLKLRSETRPEMKSEVVTDTPKASGPQVASAAAAVAGEGGTGKNIGTGESGEGFGSGSGAETAKNKYFSLIAQMIYKNKRYPRQAYSLNQEGKVVVRLKLAKSGKILDLEVLEQASYKSLTNATIETIKSINKFPPIPEELKVDDITFRIPIEYKIQM